MSQKHMKNNGFLTELRSKVPISRRPWRELTAAEQGQILVELNRRFGHNPKRHAGSGQWL